MITESGDARVAVPRIDDECCRVVLYGLFPVPEFVVAKCAVIHLLLALANDQAQKKSRESHFPSPKRRQKKGRTASRNSKLSTQTLKFKASHGAKIKATHRLEMLGVDGQRSGVVRNGGLEIPLAQSRGMMRD